MRSFLARWIGGFSPAASEPSQMLVGPTSQQWVEQTCSPNGYEREAAIHALRALGQGSAISCLLDRANDWVPEVREAACEALRSMLDDRFAGDWIAALEHLLALARGQRADHAQLLDAAQALLAQPQHRSALMEAAERGSLAVKRHVFNLQCGEATTDAQRIALFEHAIVGGDVLSARNAWDLVQERVEKPALRPLASKACGSHFAQLRLAGLRWLLQNLEPSDAHAILGLCFDFSSSVRALAFKVVADWGLQPQLVEQARTTLESAQCGPRAQAVALHMLSLASAEQAEAYCEAALESPHPRLRCVGYLRLLASVDEVRKDGLIQRMLEDPSGRVQRVAAQAVSHGAASPAGAVLMDIARKHETPAALDRMVRVLAYRPYWERLGCLLDAFGRPQPGEQQRILLNALVQWERESIHCFVEPSQSQRQLLEQLWAAKSAQLPQALAQALSFHLSTYGIEVQWANGGTGSERIHLCSN